MHRLRGRFHAGDVRWSRVSTTTCLRVCGYQRTSAAGLRPVQRLRGLDHAWMGGDHGSRQTLAIAIGKGAILGLGRAADNAARASILAPVLICACLRLSARRRPTTCAPTHAGSARRRRPARDQCKRGQARGGGFTRRERVCAAAGRSDAVTLMGGERGSR